MDSISRMLKMVETPPALKSIERLEALTKPWSSIAKQANIATLQMPISPVQALASLNIANRLLPPPKLYEMIETMQKQSFLYQSAKIKAVENALAGIQRLDWTKHLSRFNFENYPFLSNKIAHLSEIALQRYPWFLERVSELADEYESFDPIDFTDEEQLYAEQMVEELSCIAETGNYDQFISTLRKLKDTSVKVFEVLRKVFNVLLYILGLLQAYDYIATSYDKPTTISMIKKLKKELKSKTNDMTISNASTNSKIGVVLVQSGRLVIRQQASRQSEIISFLRNGTVVEIIKTVKGRDWSLIRYPISDEVSITGYVYTSYLCVVNKPVKK